MLIDILAKASNTVGIIGVTSLLTAFFLLSTNRLTAKQLPYQVMNLCGAILILYSLMFHWNTASVMIEIVWITISLIGIIGNLRSQKVTFQPEPESNIYQFNKPSKHKIKIV